MKTSLTKAQRFALEAVGLAPVRITMWGGRPFAGGVSGVRITTWDALASKGFVTCEHGFSYWEFSISPAGRTALAESASQ